MRATLPASLLWAFLLLTFPAAGLADETRAIREWEEALDVPRKRLAPHDLRWVPPGKAGEDDAPFLEAAPKVALGELRYLGYGLPKELGPYQGVHTVPSELRAPYHVYRYKKRYYVLTETDGRREQLAVYATLRALELLRERLPAEFEELFIGPQEPGSQLARLRAEDPKKNVHFLNLDAARAFVFKGRAEQAIAASGYDLGTKASEEVAHGRERARIDVYRNVPTTYLNLSAIQGYRSAKLYGRKDALENFLLYLRDGLLETLVHEALHNHLRRDKNVRGLFWTIVKKSRAKNEALGKELEEAFVSNVSIRLLRERGLSKAVAGFYGRRFLQTQRKRLGLLAGKETDRGRTIRELLQPHRPAETSYEDLFWFEVAPKR